MHEILRYPQDRSAVATGPYRDFFVVTAGGQRHVSLDKGINGIAETGVGSTRRRPAIAIRSSPWKAGSASTPWHDVFDLDNGHIRYFGDHKPGLSVPLGSTQGNALLQKEFEFHQGSTRVARLQATPILIFRSVRVGSRDKGHVEFCGLGVLERSERIVQWDEKTATSFPNYVYDIAVLDLSFEDELFDWSWVNARRDPSISLDETLARAPHSWREWVNHGGAAIPRLRRRVSRSRLLSREEQMPPPGSPESLVLDRVYHAFDANKVAFEVLASTIAGRIVGGETGRSYMQGWLTRPSGDRGIDFVSRLDFGSGSSQMRLVLLGQAKCVAPRTSISAEQLARIVARLRRGWLGAYVTTGWFSAPAQEEMIQDEYPLVLVGGRRLAEEVRLMAFEDYAGDLDALLHDVKTNYQTAVTNRRPEEILFAP